MKRSAVSAGVFTVKYLRIRSSEIKSTGGSGENSLGKSANIGFGHESNQSNHFNAPCSDIDSSFVKNDCGSKKKIGGRRRHNEFVPIAVIL